MKTSLLIILASSFLTFPVFADIVDQDLPEQDDPSQLKSITQLNSLKNIPAKQTDQAPYVHDLKNAYQVRTLFVESSALPIVDLQLTFNAGSARDESIGKGLFGIANMAANLMTEGTENYSATQIANTFEQLGAQFSVKAYRDMFVVRLRVMSDPQKIQPAINLMLEVLNHATFTPSSLNLVYSNTQVGQRQLQENPNRLIDIKLYRTLYGTHPYAQPITGTNASIRKITPALLKQFREQLLVAQNMNIAMTGQLTTQQASDLSIKIIQSLPQGRAALPLNQPDSERGFNIQHIPYQSTQAYVTMGHLGISRNDPDQPALELANQMLGGSGFNSLLMKELRVKRGYTYGAYSAFSFTQTNGIFSLNYSTKQDQLMESIQVAHKTLVDFVKQPIDRKQLEETRSGMLRAFPMSFSSNANINAQLGSIGFYGLPADYLSIYPEQLRKLTAQDVQQAIRKHIHPDNLTVIVASEKLDKEKLLQDLKDNLSPIKPVQIDPEAIHPPAPSQDNVAPLNFHTDTHASI
ncbi:MULTISPECIES: insulinase family protein [unclassified Acinetobacter]|uniref:insulinase family protein n=1 Tax=unclassified Acinetobacter TaxID=196816 RepID=UPI00190B3111|nr:MULTISPECIES: insulinase family protein [unclassified Acinetobacter]MBK0062222.1 insulinase family protein [Acinetobacter sp. S55]MBK0066026.1 insulinase family protein [Acinetobacter sp. S54]